MGQLSTEERNTYQPAAASATSLVAEERNEGRGAKESSPSIGHRLFHRPNASTKSNPSQAPMMIPQYKAPHTPRHAPAGVGAAHANMANAPPSPLSKARILVTKPSPTSTKVKAMDLPSPVKYLHSLFQQSKTGQSFLKRPLRHTFARPQQDALDAYDLEAVQAIRDRNVNKLRSMISEGKPLNACNRFGESLMHMACRRGDEVMVRFLILEGNVRLDARDDFGRTPLHDACWTSKPNFAVLDLLLKASPPDLLLAEDVRGHTPFHYARKEHWDAWVGFLKQRSDQLLMKLSTQPLSVVG